MATKTETAALDHYTETVQSAQQIADVQRRVRLGVIKGNTNYLAVRDSISKDDLQRAYDLMHEALIEIVEGGPWRCINRAEEALEDLWEIVKEGGHG